MVYKTVSMDEFEKIICSTNTIGHPSVRSSQFIDTYQALEKRIRNKQLAQSLPEYVARIYWLQRLSQHKVAENLTEISGVWLETYHMKCIFKEFNISAREGNKQKVRVR